MDLSRFIQTESETVKQIFDWHKKMGDAEDSRGYLGASSIGHECERYLWYSFRHCGKEAFDGRMYRLFETGNLEEARFVRELRAIGCTVHETDERGEQWAVHDLGGHFSGHMDGVALGIPEAPQTWHVLEFKTHNGKSFAKLVKEGVKKSKPQHYAQMMTYMGKTGMTRALYLGKNKDTDELYGERIRYDAEEFAQYRSKAKRIITGCMPPERCAARPDDFRCKFCSMSDLCWGSWSSAVTLPGKGCRTCCHSTPEIDEGETWARWSCAKHKRDLSTADQDKACEYHLLIPGFVTFAEPVDSSPEWIEFKNAKDGAVWRHGNGDGTWSTEELIGTPGPLTGNKAIQTAKEVMGGTVVGFEVQELTLIERYSPSDSRLVWEGEPSKIEEGILQLGLSDVFLSDGSQNEPTGRQIDEKVNAFEYQNKYLLVIYVADNYAAIWEGLE